MITLPKSARAVLEGPALAHLVTINPDGSPHVTVVWVGLDGDHIVSAHIVWPGVAQRKLTNLRRDPRVALSLEAGTKDDIGMWEYLVVRGRSEVVEGGAPELLQRLAYTYIGPDVGRYPAIDDPPPGFVNRITPEHIGGNGPWSRGE